MLFFSPPPLLLGFNKFMLLFPCALTDTVSSQAHKWYQCYSVIHPPPTNPHADLYCPSPPLQATAALRRNVSAVWRVKSHISVGEVLPDENNHEVSPIRLRWRRQMSRGKKGGCSLSRWHFPYTFKQIHVYTSIAAHYLLSSENVYFISCQSKAHDLTL